MQHAYLRYSDLHDPALGPLVERIVAQRASVLHLYPMLPHSQPLTEGWLDLLTAVRQRLALSGALRELVIMRVADLNGAPYEALQRAPLALTEGLRRSFCTGLREPTVKPTRPASRRSRRGSRCAGWFCGSGRPLHRRSRVRKDRA